MSPSDLETEALAGVALPTFKFCSAWEVENAPGTQWLVKGLLPTQGVAAVYGASGSGKTFLVLDLAHVIANGESWFGHRVTKPTPVIYAPLEAAGGIRLRLAAWRNHRGAARAPAGLRVLKGGEVNITEDYNVNVLGQSIADEVGPGAVVILDTLHRAAPGIDENAARDMSEVVEGTHQLQRLIGGLVILVHHTGKDASRGLRGHSSLKAAMDAVIEVSGENGGSHRFTLDKAKDGETGIAHAFKLRQVLLGQDEDGDPITSCAVDWDKTAPTTPAPATKGPAGGNQQVVLSAIKAELGGDRAQQVDGRAVLAWSVAVDVAVRALAAERKPRPKERAPEALQGLVNAGFLRVGGSALKKDQQVVWA